jgi:hypothetical protein
MVAINIIYRAFAADLKTLYVFGLSGGIKALVAMADPEKSNHRAADYPPKHVVRANPDIFFKDGNRKKQPRSLSELREYFAARVGTDVIPEDLTLGRHAQMLVAGPPPPKPDKF